MSELYALHICYDRWISVTSPLPTQTSIRMNSTNYMLQDRNKEERICSGSGDFWCNIHGCICNQVHRCISYNSDVFWPFPDCSWHIPTVRGCKCHLMRQWWKTFPFKEGAKPSRSVDFASKWPPRKEVINSMWQLIDTGRRLFAILIMANVTKGWVDSPRK